jgi:hypothetical protein
MACYFCPHNSDVTARRTQSQGHVQGKLGNVVSAYTKQFDGQLASVP